MTAPDSVRAVEALLFASREPLTPADLAARLPDADIAAALAALAALAAHYQGRGIVLVDNGGALSFRTAPDLAPLLAHEREEPRPLSRAALETLAVIAYHEPATRAEIEEIRGVAVPESALRTILAAGWVRLAGRRETPGRPMQFATTPAFLDHFGLRDRRDLPNLAELKAAGLLAPLPSPAADG